jgi:hypothetical protein
MLCCAGMGCFGYARFFVRTGTFGNAYGAALLISLLVGHASGALRHILFASGLITCARVRRGFFGLYVRIFIIVRSFFLLKVWNRYFCPPGSSHTASFICYMVIRIVSCFWMIGEFGQSAHDYFYSCFQLIQYSDVREFFCSICRSEDGIEPVVCPCGHVHCYECLYRWLKDETMCPTCRNHIGGRKLIDFSDGFVPISVLFFCF